jgi:pimeloyl-ACP methyl ester carboxylesterase
VGMFVGLSDPENDTKSLQLPQGTIRYRETGTGEPIVFVHGLLVDGRLWDGPAERLRSDFRCILPDWPMGSHMVPMAAEADLSPTGVARIIADFLAALKLENVTIVGNDSGGAISQILVTRHPERIGRLVLTNCDTHENFPPFPFNLMPPIARLPGGMTALALPFRVGAVRRFTYSMFTERPIDPALIDSWLAPSQRDAGIRRDTRKFTAGVNKRYTLEAAERLASFERPTLLAWAPGDRFFGIGYAERLAETIPDARIERIAGAKTFVALDQPERLAEAIAAFVRETSLASA